MNQSTETILCNAKDWLNQPLKADVPTAIDTSNRIVADLQQLLKEAPTQRQKLGALIGRIKGTQKAIENLEMMDWVDISGGHLAIGHRPSTKMGYDLKLQNTTHVLTLLSEGEQAKTIQSIAKKHDMEWLWFPMTSAQPPGEERLPELTDLFVEMKRILHAGGNIYVHCSAGIHRTGMISLAFLRFLSKDANEAMALLKSLRVKTSEDVGEERVAWVNATAEFLKGSN